MLNQDYKEMLQCLDEEQVEFLVVGAYALAAHGFPRSTADFDIWVNPTPENAVNVYRALVKFGAPAQGHFAHRFCGERNHFSNWSGTVSDRYYHHDFRRDRVC